MTTAHCVFREAVLGYMCWWRCRLISLFQVDVSSPGQAPSSTHHQPITSIPTYNYLPTYILASLSAATADASYYHDGS